MNANINGDFSGTPNGRIVYITTLCAEKGLYGPYTTVYRMNGEKECRAKTIKYWEQHSDLLRTDQSHLVNLDFVECLIPCGNGTGILLLKNGIGKIPVSRRKMKEVKAKLDPPRAMAS